MKRKLTIFFACVLALWLIVNGVTLFFLDHIIFRPEKLPEDYVFQQDSIFNEVFIDRPDAMIHGLFFPARIKEPAGVVLYFHGNRRTVIRWSRVTEQFLSRGYAVFIPDYRGYGKSHGKLSEQIFYEDAQASFDWLRNEWPDSLITVYGRSLGSAAASYVAEKNGCHMLVLETPLYSIPDLFTAYTRIPSSLFFFSYKFPNSERLDRMTCPVRIVAGGNDKVVPFRSAGKLREHLKAGDEMVVIEGGGHNNLSSYDEYRIFLDKAMPTQPSY